jgi:four helix bundle protein
MKTELEERTKKFAIAVVKDVLSFPRNVATEVVGRQVLRSATSIGANYREANRAESRDDFIHKVGLAEKEAAETQYWLEICQAIKLGHPEAIQARLTEAGELLAILLTIGKNARRRRK